MSPPAAAMSGSSPNPTSENPDEVAWNPYARGCLKVLGLCNVEKDFYPLQRP